MIKYILRDEFDKETYKEINSEDCRIGDKIYVLIDDILDNNYFYKGYVLATVKKVDFKYGWLHCDLEDEYYDGSSWVDTVKVKFYREKVFAYYILSWEERSQYKDRLKPKYLSKEEKKRVDEVWDNMSDRERQMALNICNGYNIYHGIKIGCPR